MECVYNSSALSNPTYGGFGTAQEMCVTFFEYYPKRNQTDESCMSVVDPQALLKLLGAKATAGGQSDLYILLQVFIKLTITSSAVYGFDSLTATVLNQNNQNKSVIDWYNSDVSWTNVTAKKLQTFLKSPPQLVLCGLQSSDPQVNRCSMT